jgi:exopolyphosphatase/guanosine-5'-triphosphate,3'-diphosphate pyrophosphatase
MTDFDSNIRVAALVLGSNSFRMTIAEISDRISINTLAQENMLIQAGKDSLMTGKLDNATMKRGWECVDLLRRIALAHQVNRIYAVATGAIWEAENGKEFIRRRNKVRHRSGCQTYGRRFGPPYRPTSGQGL